MIDLTLIQAVIVRSAWIWRYFSNVVLLKLRHWTVDFQAYCCKFFVVKWIYYNLIVSYDFNISVKLNSLTEFWLNVLKIAHANLAFWAFFKKRCSAFMLFVVVSSCFQTIFMLLHPIFCTFNLTVYSRFFFLSSVAFFTFMLSFYGVLLKLLLFYFSI